MPAILQHRPPGQTSPGSTAANVHGDFVNPQPAGQLNIDEPAQYRTMRRSPPTQRYTRTRRLRLTCGRTMSWPFCVFDTGRGRARQRAGAEGCRHGLVSVVGRGRTSTQLQQCVEISLIINHNPPELAEPWWVAAHTPFGKRRVRHAEILSRLARTESTGISWRDGHKCTVLRLTDGSRCRKRCHCAGENPMPAPLSRRLKQISLRTARLPDFARCRAGKVRAAAK